MFRLERQLVTAALMLPCGLSVAGCGELPEFLTESQPEVTWEGLASSRWVRSSQTRGCRVVVSSLPRCSSVAGYPSGECSVGSQCRRDNGGCSTGIQRGRRNPETWECRGRIALPTPPAASCERINSGEGLRERSCFPSCNGAYQLCLQTDGNLVHRNRQGQVLWASDTGGSDVVGAYVQNDNNLVLRSPFGESRYDTKSQVKNPTPFTGYLAVQNDGNVVTYDVFGTATWDSRGSVPRR